MKTIDYQKMAEQDSSYQVYLNHYQDLPRLPNPSLKERIVDFFKENWASFFVLPLVFQVSYQFFSTRSVLSRELLNDIKLTTKGHKRLNKLQEKVRQMAEKAGIRGANRLLLYPSATGVGFGAASGAFDSIVMIPLEFLVKEKDLPPYLSTKKVVEGQMPDQFWSVRFGEWLGCEIGQRQQIYPSQIACDHRDVLLTSWRTVFQRPDYEQVREGIIGHELGHIAYRHSTLKTGICQIAYAIFSLCFLHIPLAFREKAMRPLSFHFEKQADSFVAEKLSNKKLRHFLQAILDGQKKMAARYPERIDSEGEFSLSKDHPKLKDRIHYLKSASR
ncbi:MAG: Peptidase family [Chlamydiales bacterium]|jgi:Zn-dependent protease with chaperone function|nr:Peptidase family [Chlamydiales bacterium]